MALPVGLIENCKEYFPLTLDRAWKAIACDKGASGYVCRCSNESIVFMLIDVDIAPRIYTYKVGQCKVCGNFRYHGPL